MTTAVPPTPTAPDAADPPPYASADVLALSLRELRAWEAQALRQLVLCPRPEAQDWEDTELDVRRTVL